MEDVLETYVLPYDFEIPLICMDEQPIQLPEDSRPSEPMKPGQVQREDYEYVKKQYRSRCRQSPRNIGIIHLAYLLDTVRR